MTSRTWTLPVLAILVLTVFVSLSLALGPLTARAGAEEAHWKVEQPSPPSRVAGEAPLTPIGLGHIGDIEFWEPNRGLLITNGNGATIPAGVWAYNGERWRELATVCGATEGSIAWAGPDDFWTVSDGRAGQANESSGSSFEHWVPLEDNTLCHFDGGTVVGSYAHPAFEADSYQAMHAAACTPPKPPEAASSNCWFGGDSLPEPAVGSFHLHWNGSTLEAAPYAGEFYPVEDIVAFEGALYESVQVQGGGLLARPPVLHLIDPEGVPPITPEAEEPPLYASGEEHTGALDYLHLAAVQGALWGAAGKSSKLIEGAEEPGQVTVARRAGGGWSQLIGPGYPPEGTLPHPLGHVLESEQEERRLLGGEARNAAVSAFAAEPHSERAWLALKAPTGSDEGVSAVLVHISAEGAVLGEQTLPSAQEREEGIGPKGAAARIACPAVEDCWMVTSEGWLFHLAPEGERTLPVSELPGFTGLIAYRPPDQGLPQVPADAPPPDTSGEVQEGPDYGGTFAETKGSAVESKIQAALLSDVHSRLLHGSTLELRFHLAVKARVRLLAKRRKKLVASTPMRTLAAGNRKLLLRLNPHEWPTKLSLQTHPLAPLPTTTVKESVGGPEHGGAGANTVSTGLFVLPRNLISSGLGKLP